MGGDGLGYRRRRPETTVVYRAVREGLASGEVPVPQALRRLLAVVPPKRLHLTRYHGVFAAHARLRPLVALPRPTVEPPSPAPVPGTRAPLSEGPRPPRRPRLDWAALQARTFGDDVYRCPCGGRRRVLALVTHQRTAEEVLQNLGLLPPRRLLPPAQGPPQLALGV